MLEKIYELWQEAERKDDVNAAIAYTNCYFIVLEYMNKQFQRKTEKNLKNLDKE